MVLCTVPFSLSSMLEKRPGETFVIYIPNGGDIKQKGGVRFCYAVIKLIPDLCYYYLLNC